MVAKFDSSFNLLLTASPSNYNGVDIFGDELIKPAVVETDKNNDVWVTYATSTSSALIKYSSSGILLSTIQIPISSVPENIAVNGLNNIWVIESYLTSYDYTQGNVQKYSSNGILLSSIGGFARPGYIALDRGGNVWLTHSNRVFSNINKNTGVVTNWVITNPTDTSIGVVTQMTLPLSAYTDLSEDEELGGIAVDVYDRVWVIDSITNTAYIMPATTDFDPSIAKPVNVYSRPNFIYYLDNNSQTVALSSNYASNAQAVGDWTGNVWYQKYATVGNGTTTVYGSSAPFTINDYNNSYNVRKMNDSFDFANYMQSLALPEKLNSNTVLFDSFLPAVVGSGEDSKFDDLGRKSYEKISNYVSNMSDIDVCNIEQLKSLAVSLDQSSQSFGSNFPVEIQDLLDLVSIPRHKLWGTERAILSSTDTIGNQLNTYSSFVTAGTNIYVVNKYDSPNYVLYTVPPLGSQIVYPLSSLQNTEFREPFLISYNFYAYNALDPIIVNNIIDWDSPYTTFSRNLSADWAADEGIIETIFNHILTKNLWVDVQSS